MGDKVILAGCGNMGYAMLRGWLGANRLAPGDAVVVEPAEGLRARAAELGAAALPDADALADDIAPRLVVFAVKPQVIAGVVPAYRRFAQGGATFLSVAAGTGVAALQELLGEGVAIMRCMPNTPAAIGKGMMVTFSNPHVDAATQDFVHDLLSANGAVAQIEREELIDAVTGVSGSGPAYLFLFIEALAAAAEAVGLPPHIARQLAMQTVYGSACLAAQSEDEPGELRRQVTSPNGTTAAALEVLMGDDRLKRLVAEAVEAARRRAEELGR